jgi:hypothetical protein
VKRGLHKQCGNQLAVLSLPAGDRFREDNILLPVLSRAKVCRKHGMSRVLCGVDADGKQHDEPNFAADMRALNEGRSTSRPANALLALLALPLASCSSPSPVESPSARTDAVPRAAWLKGGA